MLLLIRVASLGQEAMDGDISHSRVGARYGERPKD